MANAQFPDKADFSHPEPERSRSIVIPVFIPFAGCPERCVYCAQNLSTGIAPKPLEEVYTDCRKLLESLEEKPGPAPELAFYGGTFTSLPDGWPERFMALAGSYKERGTISRIRCSTRPDAVSNRILSRLKESGLDLVELGAQSFDIGVLQASGRGHGPEAIHAAVRSVRETGLALGLQLLPGLPGMDGAIFEKDAALAAAMNPECVRLYPCLVLKGTKLARMWRAGEYPPWELDETIDRLGEAVLAFWSAGARVIRIGLAPEASLRDGILAGPVHPAMGQLARSRALYLYIAEQLKNLGRAPRRLEIPERWLSDVKGHKNAMLPAYASLGLSPENIRSVSGDHFRIF